MTQLSLFGTPYRQGPHQDPEGFKDELRSFKDFGKATIEGEMEVALCGDRTHTVPTFVNEFWTAKQRAGHSLHEISYRACFKPQLPAFFIERLTSPGDLVYDPFMGRGTTVLEAALSGRRAAGCDINPLSSVMVRSRLSPPQARAVSDRLKIIDLARGEELPGELLAFYHPRTLQEICALRGYLLKRAVAGSFDDVDDWIQMVALNRLTGHSPGFFSVYTMPPNQAVSADSQRKINRKRKQTPPRREIVPIILRKTVSLLAGCDESSRARLSLARESLILLEDDAERTPRLSQGTVSLVVTSPPFLDVVDYASDNWLRSWFIGIDADRVPISMLKKVEDWQQKMTRVFLELRRVLVPGGYVAFEVGEVRRGKVLLEEATIDAAMAAQLEPVLVLINSQKFTKTANCWGVANNAKGTNTNRVVLLRNAT